MMCDYHIIHGDFSDKYYHDEDCDYDARLQIKICGQSGQQAFAQV